MFPRLILNRVGWEYRLFDQDRQAVDADPEVDRLAMQIHLYINGQALNAGDLVACRAVILGQLGLNDYGRVKFIRDNKIRRLVEARDPFGALRLAVAQR